MAVETPVQPVRAGRFRAAKRGRPLPRPGSQPAPPPAQGNVDNEPEPEEEQPDEPEQGAEEVGQNEEGATARSLRQERGRSPADAGNESPGSRVPEPGGRAAPSTGEKPASGEDAKTGDQASSDSPGGVRGTLARARRRLRTAGAILRGSPSEALAGVEAEVREAAEKAAREALRAAWKAVHEAIEDVAFTLWYVPLLSGVPVLLFIIRLFFGQLLGQFFTINFRGVRVALVPSMSMGELVGRTAKNVILLGLTLLWIIIIIFIVYLVQHPEAVKEFLVEKFLNFLLGKE